MVVAVDREQTIGVGGISSRFSTSCLPNIELPNDPKMMGVLEWVMEFIGLEEETLLKLREPIGVVFATVRIRLDDRWTIVHDPRSSLHHSAYSLFHDGPPKPHK